MPDTKFHLRRYGDVALVTIDNGDDHTKPTSLGRSAMESLQELLPKLEQGDWKVMVLTGKPFVFCVGADITEFPKVTDGELAAAGSRAGHELFLRLRALPFPTVAAINGACLGGGLELALHCETRTISSDVRHVGFPEVFLGLFPAWGGTQLTPRLVGPEAAVKLIVSNPLRQNRMLTAREALEMGLADRLVEPVEFLDNSIAFALELSREGVPERSEPDWSTMEAAIRKGRSQADDAVHGAALAPYTALDLIEGAAHWSLEEGYAKEEEAIAELLPGPQCQASIYAFDLVERRAKRGVGIPAVEPKRIRKVGIVGAGLMARQIAALFLRRLEVPVVLRDLSQEIVDEGVEHVREEVASAAARGRLTEEKARFLASLVTGTTGYDGFADCDLALEVVVEEMAVKQRVFAELREVVREDALLMTNTSSLSVAEMGADAGLHFFNPVALMPLVEIVRHEGTSDEALKTAWEVTSKLGKRGVVVADTPGFVVNRVLTRFTRSLMDAVEHGNSGDEIDEAVLSLGMPMAPSILLGMVGPRLANHVLETMNAAYPERFPLSPALATLADGGEPKAIENAPRTKEEIAEDALEAVADEIFHMLEEGTVADAKDVDTCLLLGAGWPFFMGGATKYLDQHGISERLFGRPLSEVGAAAPA